MRIDPNVVTLPVARETRDSPSAASSKASETDESSASVVTLSSAGAAASAEPATAAAAATTTSRLETIRAMLDQGNYPVDLDLLASRIVDDDVLRAGRS